MSITINFCVKPNIIKENPHGFQYFFDEDTICDKTKGNFKYITTKKEFENRLPIKPKNPYYMAKLFTNIYKIPTKYIYDYTSHICRPKSTLHNGQLKLLLSTMYFFHHYVKPSKNTIVIYAGAAHGYNIGINIYPKFIKKWILIDPASKWDPRLSRRSDVEIIKDFFNDAMAEELRKKYSEAIPETSLVFISDIRLDPDDESVTRDNADQIRWVKILRPDSYCLKSRFCYSYCDNNGCRYDLTNNYLSGDLVIQPYAPLSSTESRLMKTNYKRIILKDYDCNEYESRFFTFNKFIRCCDYRQVSGIDLRKYGYDNCFDCTFFYMIVSDFFKIKNSKTIVEKMKWIEKYLTPGSKPKVMTDIKEKSKMNSYKKVYVCDS